MNRVLCKYLKTEKWLMITGIVSLLIGNFGTLLVPLYVGKAVDALQNDDYDKISALCIQLMLIIIVSPSFSGFSCSLIRNLQFMQSTNFFKFV